MIWIRSQDGMTYFNRALVRSAYITQSTTPGQPGWRVLVDFATDDERVVYRGEREACEQTLERIVLGFTTSPGVIDLGREGS